MVVKRELFIFTTGGLAIDETVLQQCIERALSRGQEIRTIIETLSISIDR